LISATLDTNVLIKAINFSGPTTLLLGYAKAKRFRLDISEAILDEVVDVLGRKFKLGRPTVQRAEAKAAVNRKPRFTYRNADGCEKRSRRRPNP
jgi:predicted nucleic acid-binding protein